MDAVYADIWNNGLPGYALTVGVNDWCRFSTGSNRSAIAGLPSAAGIRASTGTLVSVRGWLRTLAWPLFIHMAEPSEGRQTLLLASGSQ